MGLEGEVESQIRCLLTRKNTIVLVIAGAKSQMDLLARTEASSHPIELIEEGIAFTGLRELYFRFIGSTQNTPLGELEPLGRSS
ncbi:MAG: hypothetical protein CL915_10735 [Deltaproteobacteria bacterium]|nr:hypothetical protein [Deltaproteobacteria bacterium]